ncbi:MAG: hypothetical protein IJH63_10420 [Methanobrevibacter sp.]|nr:hypothetical protein [Methanosphaera sp.]MBR0371114.1 hypothetical protein [Methanobrevibacter sp.]
MPRFENRLNKENIKFNVQNPVWDNQECDAVNVFEMIRLLNHYEFEKNNTHNILDDFMNVVAKFQSYFHDDIHSFDDLDHKDFEDLKRLSNVSRDMLMNMMS